MCEARTEQNSRLESGFFSLLCKICFICILFYLKSRKTSFFSLSFMISSSSNGPPKFVRKEMRPRITRVTRDIRPSRRAAATQVLLQVSPKRTVLPPIIERKKAETPSKPCLSWIVKKEYKIDDVRPIIISLAYPFLKIRPPLLLQECPPFDRIERNSFAELFHKKIEICRQLCDFSEQSLETEAKAVKTKTLLELLDLVKTNKDLGRPFLDEILEMTLINLMRKIPPFPNLSSAFDEEPSVIDRTWEHLSVVYSILQNVTLMLDSIDPSTVKNLVNLLNIPHLPEREKLVDILRNVIAQFEEHRHMIYNLLIINVSDYLTLQKNPFCIHPTINLLLFMNQYVPLDMKTYRTCVLPLMSMPHLRLFLNPFVSLLQTQMSIHPGHKMDVLEYALRHCPRTKASKQRNFIFILIGIAEHLNSEEFAPVAVKFAQILSLLTLSPNVKVSETAMMIWSNNALLNLIISCKDSVVPIMYRTLVRVVNEHWNKSIQNMAIGAKAIIEQRISKPQDGSDRCQSSRYQMLAGAEKQHTAWVRIASSAAMNDISFDLMSCLNRINQAFSPNEAVFSRSRLLPEYERQKVMRFRSEPCFQELRT